MPSIPLTRVGPEDEGEFETHWSGTFLDVHLLSHVGKKRSNNEDCCLLCAPEDQGLAQARGVLVAVADGMGGVSGGGYASKLALQALAQEYFNGVDAKTPLRLRAAMAAANRAIYEEAEHNPQYYGMGTTVSAVAILGDRAYIAQVGDSRVYLLRGVDDVWQLTEDHSLVAEQVRNGVISEEQARSHSMRNLITRAVGTKESVKADLFGLQLRQGDRLMICSDGLTSVVDDEGVQAGMAVKGAQGAARTLVGRALEGGGPDNVTVACVDVVKVPPKRSPEPGAVEVNFGRTGILGALKRLFSGSS